MFDFSGGGNDPCLPESFWGEIYDRRFESVLCTMETISYAEYFSDLLWNTSNSKNYPSSRKNIVGTWASSLLNSLP